MANKFYEEANIQAIADAIREKNGTTDTYTVAEMATAISNIDTNSGADIEAILISVIEKKDNGTQILELPDSLTRIGPYIFRGNTNLKITAIPDNVYDIYNQAFAYCTGLEQISLPKEIYKIENQAFYNCTNLTQVTFRGTPTTISENVFENCTSLTNINVPWAEDEVASAPWGATEATINYNYTETVK